MPVYKNVGKYQSKAKGPSIDVPKEKKKEETGLKITTGYKTNDPMGILLSPAGNSSAIKSKGTGEYAFDGNINQPKNKVQTFYESQIRKYKGTPIVSLYDGTKLDDEDKKYLLNEQKIFDNNINEYNSGFKLRKAEHEKRKAFDKAMSVETGEFRDTTVDDKYKLNTARTEYNNAKDIISYEKAKNDRIKVQQAQQQRDYEEDFIYEKEGANIIARARSDKSHPSNCIDSSGDLIAFGKTEAQISDATVYRELTPTQQHQVDFWWGYYGADKARERMMSLYNEQLGKKMKEASKTNWGVRNVIAPATNVLSNLAGGVKYGGEVIEQQFKNKRSGIPENVPEWSTGSQMQRLKEDSREAFTNGDEGFVGKAKGLLLDTTNSLAPAAFGPAAPYVYAMQAGSDAAYNTARKGGSNSQALGMFLINAPVGFLASKGPFDELMKGSGAISTATKNAIEKGTRGTAFRAIAEVGGKHIVRQGALEGLEELAENYAYTLSDVLVNGDNSDMALEYDILVNKHNYTEAQARQMVLFNKIVKEPALSAAYGALMGGLMAGFNITASTVSGVFNAKKNGGTSYIYGGVEINEKTTAKDVLEQLNNTRMQHMEVAEGDAQFAIKESKEMGKVAFLDGKRIKRQKGESVNHAIRRYFNEIFKNKVITVEESQDDMQLDQIGKFLYPGKDAKIPKEKKPIASILDEIIEIGADKQWSQNLLDENGNVKNHAGLDCDGGFNYYDTKFAVDNSGVIYGGRVIARIDKNGRAYFYDIDKIREVGYQDENEFYPAISKTTSLTQYSLPQNAETVNSNDMQGTSNYSEDFEFDEEYAQGVLDAARAEMEAIPEATRKMIDFYSKFANVRFIIGDTDALAGKKAAGAYVNSADVILLDFDTVQDSNEVARKIVNHELTHSAERSKHYDALKKYAFAHMFNENNTYKSAIEKKIDRYGKRGVSLDKNGAEAELVAEYMGKLMSSPEAVERMAQENRPLAKNVLDSLVETYKKVTTYFKDKEAYETRYALSDIEQGIRLFEKALKTRTSVSDAIARGMGIDTRAMGGTSDGVAQYVFAGEKAKGANLSKLAEAQKLLAEGKTSKEDIWKKTGWMKGKDNKWRFEIDDSKAKLHKLGKFENPDINRFKTLERKFIFGTIINSELNELNSLKNSLNGVRTNPKYLSEFLEHGNLYENYPELKDVEVEFVEMAEGEKGEFNPYNNKIRINKELNVKDAKSTLIHEIQHAVQTIEGFESGTDTNPALEHVRRLMADELRNSNDDLYHNAKTIQEIQKVVDDRLIAVYNQIYGNVNSINDVAQRAYENFYGEIEAREVERRLDKMTDAQRRNTVPLKVESNTIPPFTHKEYQNGNLQKNKNQNSSRNVYNAFQTENQKVEEGGYSSKQKVGQSTNDVQFSALVADAEAKSENDIKISSKKAENYYNRYSNTAKKDIGKIFGIPKARLGAIDGDFDKLAGEYFKNGKISEESKNALFEKVWKEGIIIDDTNKDFAKALRKDLKSSKLYISPDEAHDIPDFGVWRRSQLGNMNLSTINGYPIDSKYSELSQQYPDLFPDDIIAPSDQLLRIAEVMERLKPLEYTLEEREAQFKEDYRKEFMKGIGEFEKRLEDVSRYEKARELSDVQNVHGRDELTVEEANNIYAELKDARKNYEKVMQKELLTLGDKKQVELVLSGDVEIENINPKRFNVEGIKKAVEARAPVELLNGALEKHKSAVKKRRFETAEKFLEGSDFWKEKKTGFSYARETMERTIYDIMGKGGEKKAKEFNDHYFAPVHEHEAQSIRNKNAYRQRVADLNLSDKITKGNTTSERFAVQFLGEIESDLKMLTSRKYISEKTQGRIKELTRQKEIFLKENPNLDYNKINNAISEFRTIYDELFEKMNEARIRNGYAPVEYRQGYFPHFLTDGKKGIKPEVATELGIGDYDEVGGIFEKFAKALGISTDVNNLPTNIAGKTQDFKPGIKFMTEALQRKGNKTDYDAVAGFDRYIESVSDVIYHTDDIQELRALERQLRYEYSEAGVKERIDAIKDNALLPEDVKNEALDRLYERNITKHGGLAQELSEYTNLLANKKSKYDRNVENLLNRKVYNVLNWANKNVAGNMIAGNLSSAMTNFIPITQASAECSNTSILKAVRDTAKNFLHNDGFESASTFLTNRKGSELLTKSTSTKISDVLSTPMEFADMFTANVVTRAKFYENIKNGMDADEAIKDADRYAAGLIADRSKGSLPTIFGAKNPLFKTFTMFQVEVNNQLSYLGKDLPKAKRNKTIAAIAGALLKYFIGAYLFNDIYEKLVGRRPALDAIGFANEITGDFFGAKMPNSIDLVSELIKGDLNGDDFKVEKKKPSEALENIAANVAEDMPFVGGVMGGGRVPISSALPDAGELSKILDGDVSWKKKGDIALKEGGKLLYGVVPFGLNQVKKTAEGISAVKKGGSYSIDKDGNKQMQFPVYNDSKGETALNYVQGALFGKSALKEAQDWRKSGFKSMSVKDTERYNKIAEQGKRKDAHQTLNAIRALEPEKDADGKTVESVSQKRYELIQNANIPEGQKAWLEISYWGDKAKERAEAAKKDANISNKQYVDAKYKYTQSDAEKYNQYLTKRQKKVFELTPEEEKKADYKRFALFNEEGLSAEQKRYLDKDILDGSGKVDYTNKDTFYLSQLSEAQNAKFNVTSKALGVNAELYYTYLKIAGSGKKNEKMANLQKHGMNQAQANAFYELAIKNRKAGDVHDSTAYNGLNSKEKAAYNKLKGFREYVEMDAAEFSVYLRAISNVKTDAEKIEILKKYKLGNENMSEIAAKGIVKVLGM
ncbi:MAG: hypothetical protein IJE46_04770 [Clostridia bacterium]|nr:hypothetical protein [Clostridia bacterium]